jgi:hypothetical protein
MALTCNFTFAPHESMPSWGGKNGRCKCSNNCDEKEFHVYMNLERIDLVHEGKRRAKG